MMKKVMHFGPVALIRSGPVSLKDNMVDLPELGTITHF